MANAQNAVSKVMRNSSRNLPSVDKAISAKARFTGVTMLMCTPPKAVAMTTVVMAMMMAAASIPILDSQIVLFGKMN